MSPSTRSTTAPPVPRLASLAEVFHHDPAGLGRACITTVELGTDAVFLRAWPVPDGVGHPADVLIGYRASPSWHAVGLVTPARSWSLDDDETDAAECRITYLASRDGEVVSLLDDADGVTRRVPGAPVGWVPDAVARVLGRPTPPPTTRPAAWVEAVWVDRIAGEILGRPGEERAWEPLAALHPLAPPGPPLPGPLLALACEQFEETSSWASLRRSWRGRRHQRRPAGGVVVPSARWFDDGTFSRWVQRDLVPTEVLLGAVLDALPGDVARWLVETLVTVDGPSPGSPPSEVATGP